MGQYDIFLIGGAAVVAGYFILQNPDWINSLFPPVDGGPTPEPEPEPTEDPEPNGNGDGDGNGGGNGGGGDGDYDCAKACRNCWCRSYSEKCGGSCSKCCGGSRIASKCNGEGVKSCKSSSFLTSMGYSYPYNDLRLTIA